MGTKGSESDKPTTDKSTAQGGQSTGTRVEVTLPMNQGLGLTPPIFAPPAVGPFIQPAATSSGLFGVIAPMGLPGTTPVPTSPPNIIVTVPPREGRGAGGAGMRSKSDSGEGSEGESDQAQEE
ncbi:MAG: hypothetical protein HPY50_01220 [Firmicutes bacterium]|nr:hypothetical protein [Bacillota bacterium]